MIRASQRGCSQNRCFPPSQPEQSRQDVVTGIVRGRMVDAEVLIVEPFQVTVEAPAEPAAFDGEHLVRQAFSMSISGRRPDREGNVATVQLRPSIIDSATATDRERYESARSIPGHR